MGRFASRFSRFRRGARVKKRTISPGLTEGLEGARDNIAESKSICAVMVV